MDVRQILAIVMLLVVTPVALAIGAVVTFEPTGAIDTESGRDYTTNQLANTDFSDNTGSTVDNWENHLDTLDGDGEIHIGIMENWNSGGYVTISRYDNGDHEGAATGVENQENGYFAQAVTIASTRDGISSATLTFDYRIIDNENASDITIEVRVDDGTDNETWWIENVTGSESASWTTVENNLIDNITTTGTYRIWLITRIIPNQNSENSSIQVGWDDANISVQTYGMGYTENVVMDVETQTATGFSLGSLLPLVIAAVALITVIAVGFTGLLGTSGRTRR